jgi:transcriptional regulator with XRE-family HTH domain
LQIDFKKKFVAKAAKKKGKSKFELEIVDLVRQKRRENKLTQENIATILNVTPGYIGQIESKNEPSMYTHDQLNVLAMEMECSPREFYPGKSQRSSRN